ncbi:DsrE family protein [Mycoplasmatota bacterium]|nr:DsrE family protein [Mycoplasmatota bacterium]
MNKIVVFWKTDNIIDVENIVIPYTHNSLKKNWWDEVVLLIWGASQKLLVENDSLKLDIEAMIHDGVRVIACIGCSNNLGVTNELLELGIEVMGTGVVLTNFLKEENTKVITL